MRENTKLDETMYREITGCGMSYLLKIFRRCLSFVDEDVDVCHNIATCRLFVDRQYWIESAKRRSRRILGLFTSRTS